MNPSGEPAQYTGEIIADQKHAATSELPNNSSFDGIDNSVGLDQQPLDIPHDPAADVNTDHSRTPPELANTKNSAIQADYRLILLVDIKVPDDRLRGAVENFIPVLMESMASTGPIQPPTVRPQAEADGSFELVCGRQRIESARRMGLGSILCRVVELTDNEAQLWAIDENLIRAMLSPAQEAIHIARRKELHESAFGKAKARGATAANAAMGRKSDASANLADAFTSDTALATGKSERTVQRIAQRAASIGRADLDRITGTSLDRKTELDSLTQLPPDTREALIEQAEAGMDVSAVRTHQLSVTPAAPTEGPSKDMPVSDETNDADTSARADDPINLIHSDAAQLEAMQNAWLNASDSARAKYLQWLAETQNSSGVMPNTWIG